MAFPVLVDACALVPMTTTDLLLRMTAARHFRILWSQEILDEVERNLIRKLGKTPEAARRRVSTMRDHFPDALVEDYANLIPAMTNDEKDRHVLAAAVRSNAELIVTFNGKDFPAVSRGRRGDAGRYHGEPFSQPIRAPGSTVDVGPCGLA